MQMSILRGNGPPFRHQRTLGSKYEPAYAGCRKILHPCTYTINQSEHFPELQLPAFCLTILGRLGKDMHNVGKISHPLSSIYPAPNAKNNAPSVPR